MMACLQIIEISGKSDQIAVVTTSPKFKKIGDAGD